MKGFTKTQKRELFNLAKKAKKEGNTLCEVFESFAKKYGKASGSVRNFYYKCLSTGEAVGLEAKKIKPFTKQEENELIKRALAERKNTGSLRRALLNIAEGDPVLALRYQNKFANLLKKQRQTVMREVILQREKTGKSFNPYVSKLERDQKSRLKREIDAIVFEINQKCEKENSILRKKIAEYQKIGGFESEQAESGNLLLEYFKSNKITNSK